MRFLIIATEMGGKTARYFERIGIEYKFVACECQKDKFDEKKTVFYECCGQHGSAIARRKALDFGDCVVFDDDYENISCGGCAETESKTRRYMNGEELSRVITAVKQIEDKYEKVILGGYSGGALKGKRDRFTPSIMQIFFGGKINRFFREDSDLYRLDDDICACIMAKRRGMLTLGLWNVIRATQEPEGVDNTNNYDRRSWAKSYLPILYAPTCARIVYCKEKKLSNGKIRPGRFHHLIDWKKMSPCVVERRQDG